MEERGEGEARPQRDLLARRRGGSWRREDLRVAPRLDRSGTPAAHADAGSSWLAAAGCTVRSRGPPPGRAQGPRTARPTAADAGADGLPRRA